MTPRQFARRVRASYRVGECSLRAEIKAALTWLNYLDSANDRRLAVDSLHRMDSAAIQRMPEEPAWSANSGDYCKGRSTDGKRKLYWVRSLPAVDARGLPGSVDQTTWARSPFRGQLIKNATVQLKRDTWRHALWLSDLGGVSRDSLPPVPDLLADLGLFGKTLKSNDRIVVYEVEVDQVCKPTLVDAGFAFFWMAWNQAEEYGMTRSMRSGLPAYREWVARTGGTEVLDAWPMPAGTEMTLDEDSFPAYWDVCRAEIMAKRLGGMS